MDNINKFKINGVVVDCESRELTAKNGNVFTLKTIKVEQEESNGRYTRKDVFEIQMDFEKNDIKKCDTVEITGSVRTNPSKDGTRHFMTLIGIGCKVIHRPNIKYQAYNNDEEPELNPCLNEEGDYPF